ncbi:chromosome segregation protein SMC [Christensenellaceae bacterium OttesenSCG-928-L17]|nr:chromosome segregation protein SMC [Christensenellaceae bacterium OttesenSCG-928-L17]
MRLTKLELHGFKSFARKTQLDFDSGITAVIGPNGSGKSNIADAVRWVLGEQSAKALRGTRMEDVIFSGTQARKAQAFCEVTLTFDNTDGTLPLEFNEVTVTRRVYRSGESEYLLNRNACRLKDIHELFRDTGIGKEGYSIIGQGRVEEILSNKSGDRRIALEEAAGVMRYRVRKEEAVRKLENTRKNLERLGDILQELDAQREPLFEQAESARAYLVLRDELKDLELNVFMHQYDRARERMEGAAAAIAQLNEEAALQVETERAIAEDNLLKEAELREIERSAAEIQSMLLDELSGMEGHSSEAKVLYERRENLQREYARQKEERAENEAKVLALQAQISELAGTGEAGRGALEKMDEELAGVQADMARKQEEIQEVETLLEEQKNSIIASLNRLSDAKSQLSRMEAMTLALNERLHALENERADIQAESAALDKERETADEAWREEAAQYDALLADKEEKAKQLQEARQAHVQVEQTLRELERDINTGRSRLHVLEEMSRAHEGYYASVRNVLRDCDRDISLRQCVLGVVAELIQVPQNIETALEMSLGSALQNIVTPTPEHANRVIQHLRERQYGRATLLPVSAMRARVLSAEERAFLQMPGCVGVASELVKFDPKYQSVVDNLLGRTVIVETLEAGIAMNKRAKAAFRIASLNGDIIHPGGSMTGGSVQKREYSILGREREIKQLQKDLKAAEERIAGGQEEIQAAAELALSCEEALQAAEAQLHVKDIAHARHKEKMDLLDRDIQISRDKQTKNELERTQIQDNLSDIQKERAGIEALQSGIEEGSAATQEDVLASQAKLAALRAQSEEINASLTELQVRRMAMQKEEDAAENEKKRLQRELDTAQRAIENAAAASEKQEAQEKELSLRIAELHASIGTEQAQVDTHKEQQQALEEERRQRADALSQSRARRDEINAQLRSLEERKHKQELALSRSEMEFSSMQERILNDYGLTYETALPLRRQPFGVTAAHVRIDELRTSIRELGNINVNAVEDYDVLSERCDNLHLQCDDLYKAESDLNTLIAELTEKMEKQFMSQFALVQANFTEVFAQLFDGGHAELRLSDSKDPLNCEIEIIAQPPGKKLQLLTLLSGGERALTAIALLFAMLKLKPTVFCILDEIESSLDEVNVTRFANYLRNYARDTQFILITHRKGSMEVCNTLYGVAMEEKGVSRLVSARFQEDASEEDAS